MAWFMHISSVGLQKVVVGVPQALKVFSWVFGIGAYIFSQILCLLLLLLLLLLQPFI